MIGERPVELRVEQLDLERQGGEDGGDDQAAHPVGRVGDHAERAQRGDVHEGVHVGGVVLDDVATLRGAGLLTLVGTGVERPLGGRPDLGQPGVLPHGTGAGQAELHAVVGGGIVGGREHGPGGVESSRSEVEHVRRRQPDVHHVGAGAPGAGGKGGGELDPRLAHVAPHDDPRRPGEAGERPADGPARPGVELIGDGASHVVGLENRVEGAHGGPDSTRRLPIH